MYERHTIPERNNGSATQIAHSFKRGYTFPGGDGRWSGIRRDYAIEDIERLRGSLTVRHTLAELGAEKLWKLVSGTGYVHALGALTGNQAVQMVKAGLQAIYVSGWQVAADAIRVTRRIVRQPALQKYSPVEYLPGDSVRDDDEAGLIGAAGNIGTTIFHPVGTARMGRDDDVRAVVDARLRVDFTLEVGAVSEVVEVTGAAPVVQTDNAQLGQVVEERKIVELPLNGRNFSALAYITPGTFAPRPGSNLSERGGISAVGVNEAVARAVLSAPTVPVSSSGSAGVPAPV